MIWVMRRLMKLMKYIQPIHDACEAIQNESDLIRLSVDDENNFCEVVVNNQNENEEEEEKEDNTF